MEQTAYSIAVQIPIVAAFVWFVLKLLAIQHQSAEKNHNEWRIWLTNVMAEYDKDSEKHIQALGAVERQMQAQTLVMVQIFTAVYDGNEDGDTNKKLDAIMEVLQSFARISTEPVNGD